MYRKGSGEMTRAIKWDGHNFIEMKSFIENGFKPQHDVMLTVDIEKMSMKFSRSGGYPTLNIGLGDYLVEYIDTGYQSVSEVIFNDTHHAFLDELGDYVDSVTEAHLKLLDRYMKYFQYNSDMWMMCFTMKQKIHEMPPDKQGRWIGYIQATLVNLGHTTVYTERRLTRPIFHEVYEKFGMSTETIDINRGGSNE